MRTLLFFIRFTFSYTFVFAATSFHLPLDINTVQYAAGDALYVWAQSGLNMRHTPSLKGEKLVNIPYGAKIMVVHDGAHTIPFTYTLVQEDHSNGDKAGLVAKGHWVKVNYQGTEGYVFDGYLSKLPAFDPALEFIRYEQLKTYGEKHFGGWNQEKVENITDYEAKSRDDDKGNTVIREMIFTNGIVCKEENYDFFGANSLFVPDISLTEGYLIFNRLFKYEEYKNNPHSDEMLRFNLLKATETSLEFTSVYYQFIIQKTDEGVMISGGGGGC